MCNSLKTLTISSNQTAAFNYQQKRYAVSGFFNKRNKLKYTIVDYLRMIFYFIMLYISLIIQILLPKFGNQCLV